MYPNLSPWSVIPNESSFGKIGHDEQGRLLETIITCKTCHIKCNVFITFYKFYATVLNVTSGSAVLSETPKAGSLAIFKLDADGISHLTEQKVGTPASQPDTYSISGKNIVFNTTTFATDGKVVCYYILDSAPTAKSFTVAADKFPSGYTIIADTTIKDSLGVEKIIQFRMNNIKPKSSMQLSFNSDDVTTIAVEWDIFADNDNNMFTFKAL